MKQSFNENLKCELKDIFERQFNRKLSDSDVETIGLSIAKLVFLKEVENV